MPKKRIATDASKLTSNPFEELAAGLADVLPAGPASPEPPPEHAPVRDEAVCFAPKLVVRREKKSRGGKTATVIEGLRADATALDAMAQALRKELGCGVRREGATLVSQGAQTERIRDWLLEQGAPKVILGN